MTATGSGPNKSRQEGPHAHETVFSADNRFLYVPDLGLDQIRIYHFDLATAKLTPSDPPHVHVEPGFGPRHIVFSPDDKFAYVVTELKPAVLVFAHDAKNWHVDSPSKLSPRYPKARLATSDLPKFLFLNPALISTRPTAAREPSPFIPLTTPPAS